MEKLNIVLIVLAIIFVMIVGLVFSDLYFNDNTKMPPNSNIRPGANVNHPQKENNADTNSNIRSDITSFNLSSCISNTQDNPQCKDCCDCLTGVDSQTRTSCRDTCAAHDFSKNSNFITVKVPSTLGSNGNYSVCVAKGSAECKTCCENQINLQCGDYQYCRTACNNAFGDPKHNLSATNNP